MTSTATTTPPSSGIVKVPFGLGGPVLNTGRVWEWCREHFHEGFILIGITVLEHLFVLRQLFIRI